ncbi:MAG: hypothetical protein ABEJ35_07590 [Halobacteriaceae archaeon]
MGEPERFRDSTQIILQREALEKLAVDLEEEFTVTVTETDGRIRIVGSPVVIKDVAGLLARKGISIP